MKNIYFLILLTLTPFFLFAQTGNIGIGTAFPASKLDVKGGITIGSNYSGSYAAPANGALIEGEVGIGLTNPQGQLHISRDTTGGGIALIVEGITHVREKIINPSTLYGGSVAVEDGLTVGALGGESCNPNIPDTCTFADTLAAFQFFSGQSATYANYPSCTQGECRQITNVYYEAEFFDFEGFPIDVNLYIKGQYVLSLIVTNAKDSTWVASGNTNVFNNQDPASIVGGVISPSNWSVYAINYGPDTDLWQNFRGWIYYNHADTLNAPTYAAFGEVRASSVLYANSTNAYGDVAEYFDITRSIRKPEPGDIVSISREDPNAFELTSISNDPLVAGVISENPSLLVNDPSEGYPIGLTGRVQVKVNTEGGIIRQGDAITSSSVLGVGKKADRSGMVVGHALEDYDGSHSDQGKIWILLARGHHSKVGEDVKIVQGEDIQLGGVELNGGIAVEKGQREVFVPWKDITNIDIPSDVDFNDLYVSLEPYGGFADLTVFDVDAEGITIAVGKKANFKGFYYSLNLVSPELHESALAKNNIKEEISASTMKSAKALYNEWRAAGEALAAASGITTDVPAGLTYDEAKAYKQNILKRWRLADNKGYNRYMELGEALSAKLEKHPDLMNTLRTPADRN